MQYVVFKINKTLSVLSFIGMYIGGQYMQRTKLHFLCMRYYYDVLLCSSVCPSGTGMHCDHAVHVSADLSLWLDSPMFWAQ